MPGNALWQRDQEKESGPKFLLQLPILKTVIANIHIEIIWLSN